ncbi:MAG: DUF4255 domain-containing protein [Dysgonomonas sp.]|nr:DUF4255 domain-containing protein [Dysgonomonas sp.]
MIKNILTYYATQLSEFLQEDFPQPEGIVEVGFIGNNQEGKKNKLLLSLFAIERETAGGITSARGSHSGTVIQSAPPLHINLNIILAAVYDEKRYTEALSALSATLLFVQSHPSFSYKGTTYLVEIVTLGCQELNNIWTTLGGQYYPSIMCRLRRLTFDAGEIKQIGHEVNKPIIDM